MIPRNEPALRVTLLSLKRVTDKNIDLEKGG
jgi:hypothetical protein